MLEGLLIGLQTAFSIQNLLMVIGGCLIGTFIGMLPGLGPMSIIAIMIPVAISMGDPSAALILLAGVLVTWVPIEGLDVPPWLGPLGLLAATGAALAPTIARRLSPWLPGPLGRLTANFPRLERPALMVVVMLLSVTTQSVVALTGHFCIQSVAPEVTVIQSLVLVPIALVSMYVPTIAGIGAREAAFVFFFGLLSVDEAAATAAGLGVGVIQLVSALFGGLVMLTLGLPQFEGDATDAIDGADSADIADSKDDADPSTDEASDEEPSL